LPRHTSVCLIVCRLKMNEHLRQIGGPSSTPLRLVHLFSFSLACQVRGPMQQIRIFCTLFPPESSRSCFFFVVFLRTPGRPSNSHLNPNDGSFTARNGSGQIINSPRLSALLFLEADFALFRPLQFIPG
jgi:hypothetical protein